MDWLNIIYIIALIVIIVTSVLVVFENKELRKYVDRYVAICYYFFYYDKELYFAFKCNEVLR